MKSEKPAFDADELNLIKLAQEYSDNNKARELLESLRWPDGAICPHCKNHKDKPIYKLTPKQGSKTPARSGVYKCGACRKQFTVTVGTIFEDSHIAISKWLMAIFILCSSKKAVSSHQIHRMLGVTYKTAWFMTHRIRHAVTPNHWAEPKIGGNGGTVEVDETFVGGKGDRKTTASRKTPVVALIERDGKARVKVVSSVTQKNLGQALSECVDSGAIVNTDEHPGYLKPLKDWKAHNTVQHGAKEYCAILPDGTKAHINTCESFFSLLKRGVYGSWHHVSREHLPKYANEFAFRWNHRKASDGARTVAAIQATGGKRMTYRQLI